MALREDLYAAWAKNEAYVAAIDDAIEQLESLGDDEEIDPVVVKALNVLRRAVQD